MTLSVLIVSTNDGFGGGEFYARDLALALEATGHKTTTFIAGESRTLADELKGRGLSVKRSGIKFRVSNPLSFWKNARLLHRVTRRARADIVIANLPRSVLLAAAATPNLTRIALLHGPLRNDPISRAAKPLIRRCLTNTPVNQRALGEQLPKAHIGVILPTAWPARVSQRDRDTITMVGRWQPYKGHLDFVAMARIMSDARPSLRFQIIGSVANPSQRAHLDRVREEIARQDLAGVIDLRVDVSGEEVQDSLGRTCVYVHPAASEDFGISIIEALLAGCPVVSYRTVGPEMILSGRGEVVRLVENGDSTALATAALDMINSVSDPEGASEAARAVGGDYAFGDKYASECSRVVMSLAA